MGNQIGFSSGLGTTCGLVDTCLPELAYTVQPTVRVVGTSGYCELKVQMWDDIGCDEDNIVRVYNKGECACFEGKYYFSETDKNISQPSDESEEWDGGYTTCDLLKPVFESVRNNGDGTFTFINGDGTEGETWVSDTDTFGNVVDNGDGTFTYINADGTTGVTWKSDTDTFGEVVDNGDGTFTYINADGSTGATWKSDTDTYGKVVDNGDGTFSWINADGTTGDTWVGDAHPAMVDTYGTLVESGDSEWTWTPADGGTPVVITGTGDDGGAVTVTVTEDCDSITINGTTVTTNNVKTQPIEVFKISGAAYDMASGDITVDTVLATTVVNKADIPGIRDCDNAVWVNAQCVSDSYLGNVAGHNAPVMVHEVLIEGGLTYLVNQYHQHADGQAVSKGMEKTFLVPFDANDQITITHTVNQFDTGNMIYGQAGGNVKVFATDRV